jgi:hypothetical protein
LTAADPLVDLPRVLRPQLTLFDLGSLTVLRELAHPVTNVAKDVRICKLGMTHPRITVCHW